MTPVPLITVAGTPAEYGTAYGTEAAGRIATNLDLYARRFAVQAGMSAAEVRAAGARFRQVTTVLQPRIAAALDGVAAGASVDVDDLYALNARTELLVAGRGVPPDGSGGGCTSIGVLDTHTADGHVLLGQNWDWHPDQRDAMVLLRTTDETGHTVLALTEAGMLAKAGLNSAGVGVCVNLLGCDRDGLTSPVGLPYHVLIRAALEARSLGAALKAAIRAPRNSSVNLLLGQPGEIIDLELVPGDVDWLNPVDGLLTHANHLETRLAVYDTIKDWGGSSLFRSARARRLLASSAAAGKVSEEDLIAVFRDHASYPQSICRHVDPVDADLDRSESVYSLLLDLDARRLALAAGPPCGHEYVWTELPA